MKALIWAGCQLIATLLIWGVAFGIELIIEASQHLPAGLTISPPHGHRNFTAVILAAIITVLFGIFNGLYIATELDVKVEAKE